MLCIHFSVTYYIIIFSYLFIIIIIIIIIIIFFFLHCRLHDRNKDINQSNKTPQHAQIMETLEQQYCTRATCRYQLALPENSHCQLLHNFCC